MRHQVSSVPDPYVSSPFGSSSGSFGHKYGSGSFHHKNSTKNIDFCCFVTFLGFLSHVSVPVIRILRISMFLDIPDPHGSVNQRYGSEDPDPYQNCTNSEHWFAYIIMVFFICNWRVLNSDLEEIWNRYRYLPNMFHINCREIGNK